MRQQQDMKRAYVLLPSVTCIIVILYKSWGPLLFITFALLAVVHTCYSLLCRDCLFDRRSFVFLKKLFDLALDIALALRILASFVYSELDTLLRRLKNWIEQRNNKWKIANREEMNPRRNSYRLSTSVSKSFFHSVFLFK